MSYDDIRKMPTTITPEMMRNTRGVHQSCTRAYHILDKVKTLLDRGTDAEIVRELVALMEDDFPGEAVTR